MLDRDDYPKYGYQKIGHQLILPTELRQAQFRSPSLENLTAAKQVSDLFVINRMTVGDCAYKNG